MGFQWAFFFFFSLKRRSHLWCLNTFSAQRSFSFVSAWCMWCSLCHAGRGFNVILALLAASHTSAHPPGLMLVYLCWFVYVYVSFWVHVLALAASCLPLSLHLTLFVWLYCTCPSSTATHRKWNPLEKCHPRQLPSKSTRGQSVLVWRKRGTSFVLLWCSQFKQRKECWERGTSLWREGGKDGRREGRRMREREIKWREQWECERETDLCVRVCI